MKKLALIIAASAVPLAAQNSEQRYICSDITRERVTLEEGGSTSESHPLQRFELILAADRQSARMRGLTEGTDLPRTFVTYNCKAEQYSLRCWSASATMQMAWNGSYAHAHTSVVSQRMIDGQFRTVTGVGQFRIHSGVCEKS
ncbi:hypothetical protein [Erythrobacter aurantius]|uniref:hypothetical protein n=1 Tax=Erythrobacter aurantius TaxID=2909249 RepID=UPI00207A62C6|nr:hypothetical protein [Erythrobacter aurantius]